MSAGVTVTMPMSEYDEFCLRADRLALLEVAARNVVNTGETMAVGGRLEVVIAKLGQALEAKP